MRLPEIFLLAAALGLLGCASTQFDVAGKKMPDPICKSGGPNISAVVYWATKWRENQKEPIVREEMAKNGISSAIGGVSCLNVLEIKQVSWEQASAPSPNVISVVESSVGRTDRIVVIGVRELGPTLEIGIPVFVKGGTEVLIDVRVIDVGSNQLLAEEQSHWRNGGPFVIKGIKTLEADIGSALLMSLGLEKIPEDG